MADAESHEDIVELRRRLEEAESTLTAIRNGEVDALVVGGREIYTLEGADHPYRILVEAMQQGAVTLSPDGCIVYCNAGFALMVGCSAEKLIGLSIEDLFPASDRLILRARLANGSSTNQAELSLIGDDGTLIPVLISFNVLPMAGLSANCLVFTNLTEQKDNQRLQDSDRRKDEFLAMLAHELRNPLAPISNAIQLICLSNNDSNKELSFACDIVDRQVKQMTRIVDDLLDVSRITRGKINLQKAPVDVSLIVSTAVETSRPLIESRRHKLHISLASEPLKVEADLTRLSQVVTNLLNNAAKYTQEGGEIWVEVKKRGSDAVITVRDNGDGLPPELLPTVFDLFTQADRTIDRSQGGLGIGLTLVRRLVELHGGSVSVSSEGVGHGSEFTVQIPLYFLASNSQPPIRAAHENRSPARSQRILVVDDNIDAATTLSMMLTAMGHEAVMSYDGPTAIELAQTFKPALVLLDIGLPGMNGYTVAERLRKLPSLNGVTLAALTGYGEEQDRQRSKTAGFDRHFVKPLDFAALLQLIDTLPKQTVSNG